MTPPTAFAALQYGTNKATRRPRHCQEDVGHDVETGCDQRGNRRRATGNRSVMGVHTLLLALGANQAGAWGPPGEALQRARAELSHAGVRVLASSPIYDTLPLGPGRQSPYLNAVLLAEAHMAPAALLR